MSALIRCVFWGILLLSCAVSTDSRGSQPEDDSVDDFMELDLEELSELDVVVTSVSKKEERLAAAPSAVYVVTQEDIRRSGATSIPEALRMVPGLHVARVDSQRWIVSVRGFSHEFATKLLVLIDGRSVYTPLFSGVYWDVQDLLLEDVDRIEVIRGPGATLWGANAVNGVINIITRSARDTQGGFISALHGTEDEILGLRYGWQLPSGASVRAWGKFKEIDSFKDEFGQDAHDEWSMERGGFQLDWDLSDDESLTFQGGIYNGDLNARNIQRMLVPPFSGSVLTSSDVAGGHFLLRWRKSLSETSDTSFRFYYDRTERQLPGFYGERRDTFDFEFDHRFALSSRQELVWGLGYRNTSDRLTDTFFAFARPSSAKDDLFSAFVQDTLTLIDDTLKLTLGSKFEYNDYSGFEIQPSLRIVYTPDSMHTTWASISRAVRTPSRSERDVSVVLGTFPNPIDPTGLPVAMRFFGDSDFDSEELIAYEIGQRFQVDENLSIDLAGFFNVYDDLRTMEPSGELVPASFPSSHVVAPLYWDNRMDGETYGVEVSADYRITSQWRVLASYSLLRTQLHPDSSSGDFLNEDSEGSTPRHQFNVRSYYDLPCNMEFDTGFYAVGHLSAPENPSYTRFDARLGWHPRENLELSLVVQNAFKERHSEFGDLVFTEASEVERSVYGKLIYRF